jgi:hypothetical protein
MEPNLDMVSYEIEVRSSSASYSSPLYLKLRYGSGEFLSLAGEHGEAIEEAVLGAPNEKSGDGRGPGRGEPTARDEKA